MKTAEIIRELPSKALIEFGEHLLNKVTFGYEITKNDRRLFIKVMKELTRAGYIQIGVYQCECGTEAKHSEFICPNCGRSR